MTQVWANFIVSDPNCTCCNNNAGPSCMLELPPFSGQYANISEANSVIANQTSNCFGFATDSYMTITASFSANVASVTISSNTGGQNTVQGYIALYLLSGSGLNIDWNGSSTGANQQQNISASFAVYYSNWSQLGIFVTDEDTAPDVFSGSQQMPYDAGPPPSVPGPIPIPSDGCYFILLNFASGYGTNTNSVTCDFTVTANNAATAGGIRAAYDDGMGGTDYVVCV